MEDECKVVCALSNSAVFDDLEQARREGGVFPAPRDVWGAPPSLKNSEKGVPRVVFLT